MDQTMPSVDHVTLNQLADAIARWELNPVSSLKEHLKDEFPELTQQGFYVLIKQVYNVS